MSSTLPVASHLALDALDTYANHYRFGVGGPAVVYYGGAVSRAVYEARRRTAPTLVAEAFDAARTSVGVVDVDLFVCPCPLSTGDDDERWVDEHHAALSSHLDSNARALGVVGYSAGAHYALLLAVLAEARGAACVGGAGVAATLTELEPILRTRSSPFRLLHLMNAGDPLGLGGLSWAPRFASLIALESRTGPGQHPFADYVANGFVARAFEHALTLLNADGA